MTEITIQSKEYDQLLLIIGLLVGICVKNGIDLPAEVREWIRLRY